jgi:hypothetical protein
MGCSFYFVYWAISIVALIAALLIRIGSQFPAFSEIANQINLIFLMAQVNISAVTWFIAAGLIAGVIGFWLFQKWAVIIYAASTAALLYVTLHSAPTLNVGLILYVLVSVFALNIAMIVLGIINFKRMK